MYGYSGKILHVNLNELSWEIETPDDSFYRKYLGGGAMGAYYLLKNSPKKVNAWAAYIASFVPFYFLALYIYYLYWYGHHLGLHGGGAFEGINEFMPTVFGEGKVAQFTTESYPAYGFGFAMLAFIVIFLSILLKKKDLKTA